MSITFPLNWFAQRTRSFFGSQINLDVFALSWYSNYSKTRGSSPKIINFGGENNEGGVRVTFFSFEHYNLVPSLTDVPKYHVSSIITPCIAHSIRHRIAHLVHTSRNELLFRFCLNL